MSGEGKGLNKEELDKTEKKENKIQRKHSAYHSGLETLVQKSYTGPRGTKYNVSVDSYLHESAIRIIMIQLLRNSRLLTRARLTQETYSDWISIVYARRAENKIGRFKGEDNEGKRWVGERVVSVERRE